MSRRRTCCADLMRTSNHQVKPLVHWLILWSTWLVQWLVQGQRGCRMLWPPSFLMFKLIPLYPQRMLGLIEPLLSLVCPWRILNEVLWRNHQKNKVQIGCKVQAQIEEEFSQVLTIQARRIPAQNEVQNSIQSWTKFVHNAAQILPRKS